MSWDYPENKATNQRNAHVVETKEEDVNAVAKEETLEAWESLLLKRVLVKAEKEVHELAQSKSLFKTICKSRGTYCKIVINSGRKNNVVSTKMVDKLGLRRLVHPTPYIVSYLQKGHHILVNEQCKVEFYIGSYKDEVLCDIMPMNVFHIMLGRSLQYDRKSVLDGRRYTYSLEKNGNKHVLLPLKDETNKE
jgi:hypothetical protein